MNILLTGASGFLGKHLAQALTKTHSVYCLGRSSPTQQLKTLKDFVISPYTNNVDFVKHKTEIKFDCIIHLAALFISQHQADDIQELFSSNVLLSSLILEFSKENDIKKIIFTGTSWQHYKEKTESVNLYAASKAAMQPLFDYYAAAHDIQTIVVKIFDNYGPADTRKKLFSLFRNAVRTQMLLKMSPGEQLLNLVYVADAVRGIETILNNFEAHSCIPDLALGTHELFSLKQVAQIYSKVVQQPLPIEWGALPYRNREVMLPWQSFATPLGWQATTSLSQGIALMEVDSEIGGLLSGSSQKDRQ